MSSNRSKPSATSTNGNSIASDNLAKSPLADLHIKFRSQVSQLSSIFPDWTVDDLVLTLDEAHGDVEIASMRILEGHAARWTETHVAKSKAEKRTGRKNASHCPSSSSPGLSSDPKSDRRNGSHRPTSGESSRPSRPSRTDRERGSGYDQRGGRGGRLQRNRPTDTSANTPSSSSHASQDAPSSRETGPPSSDVGSRNLPSNSSNDEENSSLIPDSLNDPGLLNSDAKLSESLSNQGSAVKQWQSPTHQATAARRHPLTNLNEYPSSRLVNQSRQRIHGKNSASVSAQLPQAPKFGWAGPSQKNTSTSSNVSSVVKPKSTWAQIARAAPPIQEQIVKKSLSPNRGPSPSFSADNNEYDVTDLPATSSPVHPDNDINRESSPPENVSRSPSRSPSRGRSPAPRPLSPPVIPDPVRIPSPTRSLSPSRRSPTPSSSAVSHQNRQSDMIPSSRPRSPSPPPQVIQQQTQNVKKAFKSATSSPVKSTTAKSGTSSAVEGVVLPAHMAIPNLGVKFGSLHLDEASYSVTAPISTPSNTYEATTEQGAPYSHEEPVKPNIPAPATPASIPQHPSVQSAQALPTVYNPYGYSNPGIANAATIQSQQQQLQQMGVGSIDLAAATAAVANPYYPSSATIAAPVSVTSSGSAAQGQNANAYYGYNMIGMGAGIGGVTAADPYSSMYGGVGMDRSYYDPSKVTGATDSTAATSETSTTSGQPQSQSHHQPQPGSQQQHPAAAAAAAAVAAAAYMQPGGYPNPYSFGYHPYFMPQQFNPQAAAQYHHHPHHNPQAAAAAAAAMYGQYMNPRGTNASGSSGVNMSHHVHPSAASSMMYGTTASPAAGSGGGPSGSTVNSAAQSGGQTGQQTNANTGAGAVQQQQQQQSQGQNQAVKQTTGYYEDRHHQHQHNYHQHGNTSTGTPGSHHHSTHHTPQQQAHAAAATMYAHHQQQQHHQYQQQQQQQQQQYAAAYAASAYNHGQWAPASGTGVSNQPGSQSGNNGPTGVNSTGSTGSNVNKSGYYCHNQTGNPTSAQHHQSTGQSSGNSSGQQQSSANQQNQSTGQSQYPYARQYTGWTHSN